MNSGSSTSEQECKKLKTEEEETLAQFADVYRSVCTIPNPLAARIIPHGKNIIIESHWHTHDFARMTSVQFTCTYFGDDLSNMYSSILHDKASASVTAISHSGALKAIIREEQNSSAHHQYLDIWSRKEKLFTYDALQSKSHGKIYDDEILGTLAWNNTEDSLLYVAEKLVPKSESYFKKFQDISEEFSYQKEFASPPEKTAGEEYALLEDWGEMYTGKRHSVLCTLNIKTKKINVLPILQTENFTLCEPIWTPDGKSIYFVAYVETPYRLGIKFCTNRESKIYHYDLNTEKLRLITTTCDKVNARSPRISPDNKMLLYLENEANGPHFTCSKLVKCTSEGKHVVMDTVKHCGRNDFPGIYIERLPERCFSKDGRYVFFSSIWHCCKVILCVDFKTDSFMKIPAEFCASSYTVLDVFEDVIVASASAPNIEPFLIAGKLCFYENSVTVLWAKFDQEAPKYIEDINWSVRIFDPPNKNPKYADLTYEAIILTPKKHKSSIPVILSPHGGPHSAFITSFNEYAAAFVRLGYAMFLVNYRGSLGYGMDSINSLLGNVGEQDVADVYYVLQHMKKKDEHFSHSDVFLYGGSHGGFIVAHLSAKYPDEFAACACRNPVVDISSMAAITDIPDWTFVECGIDRASKYSLPDLNELSEMWNRSPIKYFGETSKDASQPGSSITMKHYKETKVPTLLLLGKKDRRVPHCQGMLLYRALKCKDVPVKVYLYDDGHKLDSFSAQSDGFMQLARWFHMYKT